jgi:hypothetical protein
MDTGSANSSLADRQMPQFSDRDMLLASPPRSGSTLVCWLLNQVNDIVALPEPMDGGAVTKQAHDLPAAIGEIRAFLSSTRNQILTERRAPAKLVDGVITSNMHEEPHSDGRLRKERIKRGYVTIEKPLSANFILLIKHPALFMGLLPQLLYEFPIFGVVRNPLATLASWNTIDVEFYRGRAPNAEAFAPELVAELVACPDRIDRQVRLLRWYFERLRLLPRERVIRYEDLVVSPGETLGKIIPAAASLKTPLQAYDPATRYAGVPLDELRTKLEGISASFQPYYDDF